MSYRTVSGELSFGSTGRCQESYHSVVQDGVKRVIIVSYRTVSGELSFGSIGPCQESSHSVVLILVKRVNIL